MKDSGDGSLRASRVKGSKRQLFSTDTSEGLANDFLLRPADTRSQYNLAKIFQDLDFSTDKSDICTMDMTGLGQIDLKRASDPLLLTSSTDNFTWPAGQQHWSPEALELLLGTDSRLEVAQENATVSLGDYVKYLNSPEVRMDDNPVYIFETLVDGEHDEIIKNFAVPGVFTDLSNSDAGCHTPGDTADLLSAAGDDGLMFGLHRWLIMGPERSGSNMHVDPLGTSAWNTLLMGRKLWVLFPPHLADSDLQLDPGFEHKQQPCSVDSQNPSSSTVTTPDLSKSKSCAAGYFATVLPNLPPSVMDSCVQLIQEEGETIFVPAGWHHAVLNLETTVCVTQNFASPCNYTAVAKSLYNCSDDCEYGMSVDEWRGEVASQWPSLRQEISSRCVHCEKDSNGNTCDFLDNRPVCVSCAANLPDVYEELTEAQVESMYDLQLWKLPRDEIPPSLSRKCPVTKRKTRFFLHAHIKVFLEN